MVAIASAFSFVGKMLWEVWGEPFLGAIGAYEPEDRTYGRWKVPFSPMEQRLHENLDIAISFHKAMMPNGKDWVWYQIWEDKQAQSITGRKADMIFVHGTGVHSGTLASHSRRYLDAGFRLIVPDLPSHGYSSGLHVYVRHLSGYLAGLRQVLHDVAKRDDSMWNGGIKVSKAERRPTFMLGLSFGGLLSLAYGIQYPGSFRQDTSDPDEIPIDGLIGVGPMIGYSSKNIRIPRIVEAMCRFSDRFLGAGRLEVFVPHKKCLDKDPNVYKTLVTQDKRSHHGAFRVGHLLCIDDGMNMIRKNAHKLKHPIYVQVGNLDRVAEPSQCVDWVRNTSSEDKKITMYPVCQHVIYRKAKTEEEDRAGRVAVIEDNVQWMSERSPGYGRLARMCSFASDISSFSCTSEGTLVDDFSNASTPSSVLSTPMTPTSEMGDSALSPGFFGSPIDADLGSPFAESLAKAFPAKQAAGPLTPLASPGFTDAGYYFRDHSGWLKAKDAEEKAYRPKWDLSSALRPYDLPAWKV
ncbi:alpha/beta-hydrolase [Violaceomyces palustris]|uniref:Alpha/beta-hydrolase n=1 Tax=Violaceomyces palustris TaxID=1673888 RepID=A0ACD0P172_9BASI|nr:alpha/beta-hydrolase [Violaceomyces palustris]